MELQIII